MVIAHILCDPEYVSDDCARAAALSPLQPFVQNVPV